MFHKDSEYHFKLLLKQSNQYPPIHKNYVSLSLSESYYEYKNNLSFFFTFHNKDCEVK